MLNQIHLPRTDLNLLVEAVVEIGMSVRRQEDRLRFCDKRGLGSSFLGRAQRTVESGLVFS